MQLTYRVKGKDGALALHSWSTVAKNVPHTSCHGISGHEVPQCAHIHQQTVAPDFNKVRGNAVLFITVVVLNSSPSCLLFLLLLQVVAVVGCLARCGYVDG